MAITRINKFIPTQDKSQELFDFLNSLIPYILNSQGCLSCEVLKDEYMSEFVVVEKWENIEAHTKSIENFPKEEMQIAMPLFGAPPEGKFYF